MTSGDEECTMRCARGFFAGGRRIAAVIAIVLFSLLAFAGTASAHPLGNFTVNRYARVEISNQIVRVYYVLDEAEIPTFQDRSSLDPDPRGFAAQRAAVIAGHLKVTVDGQPLAMEVAASELSLPQGQGGLPTLRLAIRFEGRLPAGAAGAARQGTVADSNEPDRIGWREIVVTARGDGRVTNSSAPGRDVSDELRHYPADLVQAPLDLRSATFDFVAGTVAVPPQPLTRAATAPKRYGGSFTALIQRPLTPLVLIGMIGVALLFGAAHALAPGHGKTIMAAYLVGTKGRPRDAFLLGGIVSVMHTASVLVLGLVLFQLSHSASPDRVYPWLKLGSGLAVAFFGAGLLWGRWRSARRRRPPAAVVPVRQLPPVHDQVPERVRVLVSVGGLVSDHEHDHEHDHQPEAAVPHHGDPHGPDGPAHGPGGHVHGPGGHSHELPDGVAPLSRRGLAVLATAGGLFPSPSALIVLLAAFQLHRIGLGLTLIAAFSVGLAATLTAVGLALVYGRRVVERRGVIPALRLLPVVSAAGIVVLGIVFALSGAQAIR
jgi:nickel/cobalt transporter (NicO) family protein